MAGTSCLPTAARRSIVFEPLHSLNLQGAVELITTLAQVAEGILKFLSVVSQRAEERTAAEEEALRAICEAVDETQIHLTAYREGNLQALEPSRELAALWRDAALKIRAIDPDLAFRLRMKAEYWTNPRSWTPARIQQARIRLDHVAARARVMLRAGIRPA